MKAPAKEAKFQMRSDPQFNQLLDDWRRKQIEIPSRAEAIRHLVKKGIESDERERASR